MVGERYYSADNGFTCAAAGRGVPEALREHLNVIVRNEELETETSNAEIQAEINDLVEDKERLEQQKLDRQDSINELTEQLKAKEADLAQFQVELEVSAETNGLPPDEDTNTLREVRDIEENIENKMEVLDAKKIELAGLEVQLEAPTPTELNMSVDGTTSKKISIFQLIFAVFATFTVLGMLCYLIVFYASAGEKSLIAESATSDKIINASALSKAWEAEPKNWLIIFFPFVFVGFALMIHCFFIENIFIENNVEKLGRRTVKGVVGLIGLGFVFYLDFRIAEKISRDIYNFRVDTKGREAVEDWSLWNSDLTLILLLGFVVALLLSFVFYYVQELWKRVRPHQNEAELLSKQIVSEKNPGKVQLVTLTSEIQQLENRISELNQEKENYKKKIEETFKHPIKLKIARLNTEKEGLQSKIDELNEQVESLQTEINQCETEIEALLKRKRVRIIDLKKLEAQTNEFISGWCRYVAQSRTELSDSVSLQIKDIQNLANDTLEEYKATLTTT